MVGGRHSSRKCSYIIDFQGNALVKLTPINSNEMLAPIRRFLIDGETVLAVFKTIRDQVVFTNKRVIAANVQGLTGKKSTTRRFSIAISRHVG